MTLVRSGGPVSRAVTTAGTVRCWGDGDGARDAPADLGTVRSIEAAGGLGTAHVCAVTVANEVRCWGDDTNPGSALRDIPQDQGPVDSVAVGGGFRGGFGCAVPAPGAVRCWGSDDRNQLDVPAELRP